MSFELVVQKAIYEKIKNNADIIAKAIPVHDDVPQPVDSGSPLVFPYVVVGDDSLVPWDTDTELGADISITIHTWSRYLGRAETKEIQGYIYETLHDVEFDLVGYESVLCVLEQSQSFLDADGKTRHGVQTFRMLIEKT